VTGFLIAVLLVVAFVWGQMVLLRPSPRDQRLMALRAEARRLGLHARLLPPPDWHRGAKPHGGLLACYSVLTGDEDKGLPYFRAERLSDGEWIVRQGDKTILPALRLPSGAATWLALEARANALSLWWMEEGAPEDLPAQLEVLSRLREKLS
jgi:hypothetical protein